MLRIYPFFAQVDTTLKSGDILPDEANVSSIRFRDPVKFTVIPENSLSYVRKGSENFEGEILDHSDNTVSLKLKDSTTRIIRNYDLIESPSAQNIIYFLSHLVKEVSYTISSSSWNAIYNLNLNQGILDLNAKIDFPFAYSGKICLMAGDIKTVRSHNARVRAVPMAAMAQSPMNYSETPLEDISEYKSINLEQRTIQRGTNIISITRIGPLKLEQIYYNDIENNDVHFGYVLNEAPTFMPTGIVTIYQDEAIIGQSSFKETQMGKEVKFTLGKTSRVIIKNELSQETNEGNVLTTKKDVHIRSQIDNTTNNSITLILKYYINRAQVSRITCQSYHEEEHLCFRLTVPSGKNSFECSFHLDY